MKALILAVGVLILACSTGEKDCEEKTKYLTRKAEYVDLNRDRWLWDDYKGIVNGHRLSVPYDTILVDSDNCEYGKGKSPLLIRRERKNVFLIVLNDSTGIVAYDETTFDKWEAFDNHVLFLTH